MEQRQPAREAVYRTDSEGTAQHLEVRRDVGVCQHHAFALRAFSYASAQAGQYLARIYGDGASGDAATTVYADVRAKADGTPDWANAV